MLRIFVMSVLVLATIGSVAIPSAVPTQAQEATPSAGDTEATALLFVDAMNDVFATGDASLLDDIVSPDFVDNTPSPTRTGGEASPDLAGLKSTFEAVHEVFPEANVVVDEAIVEGDMAALLVTFNGLRGPDTVVDGVLILRVEDGTVVESWNYERRGEARLQPMFEATPEP